PSACATASSVLRTAARSRDQTRRTTRSTVLLVDELRHSRHRPENLHLALALRGKLVSAPTFAPLPHSTRCACPPTPRSSRERESGERSSRLLQGAQSGSGEDQCPLLHKGGTAVREAIAMFEDGYAVVGQAATLAEARPQLGEVDVAVVDLGLSDGFGGDLITELRDLNPRAQALVLIDLDQLLDTWRRLRTGNH
ncbi:MAG: hypothetical protein LC790_01590, partial [Actinobacteria bacterium]|nr:hypothetical protein [Actinomycetota bacterium]